MIVDDQMISLQIEKSILDSEGYCVDLFLNPTDALDAFQNYSYDVVLLDIIMPDINGYELCSQFKKIHSDVPVIFVTADLLEETIASSFIAGCFDFIRKPVSPYELKMRVKNALRVRAGEVALKLAMRKLEEKNSELKNMLLLDSMTGLYNHKYAMEKLTSLVEESKRYKNIFSIIMLDLDNFKKINDLYGHQIGDIALKITSEIIAARLRTSDIPSRYGGEEFLIILPHTNIDGALIVAEDIRIIIESTKIRELSDNKITISAGVAHYEDNDSSEKIVQRADKLLYLAKNSGKNKVCHDLNYLLVD